MRCEEVKNFLSDYIDGELNDKLMRAVRTHLESCEHCRTEAEELTEIGKLLARTPEVPLPEGFSARLHEALAAEGRLIREKMDHQDPISLAERRSRAEHAAKKPGTDRSSSWKRWRALVSVAAVFLVGFVSFAMYNDSIPLPDTGVNQEASSSDSKGDSRIQEDSAVKEDQRTSAEEKKPADSSRETKGRIGRENTSAPDLGEQEAVQKKAADSQTDGADLKWSAAGSAYSYDSNDSSADFNGVEAGLQMTPRSGVGIEEDAGQQPVYEASSAPAPTSELAEDSTGGTEDEGAFDSVSKNFRLRSSAGLGNEFDQTVSILTDAINQRDQSKMEQAIVSAGKRDHVEDRAKAALKFYGMIFDGTHVSAQYEEKQTSAADAFYQLSAGADAYEVYLTALDRRITIHEGVLNYSYEVDQALQGEDYTLVSYTAQNGAGRAEFTINIGEGGAGSEAKTAVFVCENGMVNRVDQK